MATTKVTFTLDEATIARLERAAATLSKPKSEIVRDAIFDYSERLGKLSEPERLRMLKVIDEMLAKSPTRDQREVDEELREIRRARRTGGLFRPVE